MPSLYCEKHGREREEGVVDNQEMYRQVDERVLVTSGKLISGPWLCDRCDAEIGEGSKATLVSAFPSHCYDNLYDYDFGYERQYFAMTKSDTAKSYEAEWPDDSISSRRTINQN